MNETQAGATDEWLSPSTALNRLELAEHELAHESAVEFEAAKRDTLRHGVAIGSFNVLLPPDEVSEVIKGANIFPVPKTASWVRGLLNLRGNLVPVFDLTRHFEPDTPEPESLQTLAIGKGENAIALVVDGIPKLASTDHPIAYSALPLPDGIRNQVRAAYMEDDSMWLELDLPSLIESLTDEMEA